MKTKGVSFTWQLVAAMVLGTAAGLVFGDRAAFVGEFGRLIIQLVKTFATPLLFFAILEAVISTRVEGKHAGRMLMVAFINATIALTIGLTLSNVFRVGDRLAPLFASATGTTGAPVVAPKIEFSRFLSNFVPTSVMQPFVDNIAITVILLALLLGFALRALKNDPEVGRAGLEGLHNLGYYVALALGGLALHVLITHHAWLLYLRRPIGEFWRAAREPVVYAMGTNSSLASLPLTLKALDRLKVSRASSTLGACVGTNFNNDGILLYEGMAALMVAQALGSDLSFSTQLTVALLSMVAAMGIAGVPEAGFISLAVVLTTLGLSVEALPLLLTVDWIVARGRSVVNVLSDMVVSLAIEGKQAESSPVARAHGRGD